MSASNILLLENIIVPDQVATKISQFYQEWEMRRQIWVREKEEIQRYVFATDTTKTTNAKLPWSNKTTIPKLCQVRDNLASNYIMALFPKRKWMVWEGNTEGDEEKLKKSAIEEYMSWVVDRNEFYEEVQKLVYDYIDYGNCIATVEWVDKTNDFVSTSPDNQKLPQVGFVGPMVRRISPIDIVFNPTAVNFASAPKIIRSLVSIGELKDILERASADEGEKQDAQELFTYLRELRSFASNNLPDNMILKDAIYQISGFDTYRDYLTSGYCEILTFMGDIYDENNNEFLRNQVIKIVDRHKIISKRTHPSYFGQPPIYHAGWRIRPDNLWAMGPLDNLVGMQYRIDHLENIKADVFDLVAYPPLEIRGYVDDFTWGPFEKIYTSEEGQINLLSPDVQAMQADTQIAILEQKMEEMAGSPKEAMGFRTPGEKTKYEVQRLENAASRIFQNKINQFERSIVENLLNAMLEMSRRLMTTTTIRVLNDELKIARFRTLSAEDLTGNGRIKPVAARHFAEQAQIVQDISNFYQTAIGQDPEIRMHFSSIKLAQMLEGLLSIEDYKIVQPYIRISEQADAQLAMNIAQEQSSMQTMTPSGLSEGDYDQDLVGMDEAAEGPGGQGQAPAAGPGGPPIPSGQPSQGAPQGAPAGAY